MPEHIAAGPDGSPGYWLHHAALAWRHVCEAGLDDITYPQFNFLSAVSLLAARHEPPTQQQAAQFARMDRMMASKLAATLEQRGLLARSHDPRDARKRQLVLTDAGRQVLRRCITAAKRADDEVFGRGPQAAALRDALRLIAERGGRSIDTQHSGSA